MAACVVWLAGERVSESASAVEEKHPEAAEIRSSEAVQAPGDAAAEVAY